MIVSSSRFSVSSLAESFLFLFVFISISFSDTGYMRAIVEKDWVITTNSPSISDISLDGFFLVNNSNQRVLTLETNGEVISDGELIKIKYRNPNSQTLNSTRIYARATVEVSYTPFFSKDESIPFVPITAYGASAYTQEIKDKAYALSPSSSLAAVAALTEWVHENIAYNISYFGKSVPASEVFVRREGVCTEYAHLLLAMLNSLGIKSRFVSGYVFQNDSFQPHAWVEAFVGSETVAADPTFGEAGAISATHVAMFYSSGFLSANKVDLFYGENRSEAFDVANASGGDFELTVNVSLTPLEFRSHERSAALNYSYNNKSGELTLAVSNPSDKYVLLPYFFNSPEDAYGQDSGIIALAPQKTLSFKYPLYAEMEDGYVYTIPFVANVPGTSLNSSVKYSPARKTEETRDGWAWNEQPLCPPLPVFLLIILTIVISKQE